MVVIIVIITIQTLVLPHFSVNVVKVHKTGGYLGSEYL